MGVTGATTPLTGTARDQSDLAAGSCMTFTHTG
jgi:hypothetical protein